MGTVRRPRKGSRQAVQPLLSGHAAVSPNQARVYDVIKLQDWFDSVMNAPSRMAPAEVARARLEVLRREHRDLDEAIRALEENTRPDPLTLRRLKKQKLALKDRIARIEDGLIPDIIA